MSLAQKLIKLEHTIQHQSTPTPPHHQHILPYLPHGHPYIRKHSGYQHFIALATSHPLCRNFSECRSVHTKLERGYTLAACSESRCIWTGCAPSYAKHGTWRYS